MMGSKYYPAQCDRTSQHIGHIALVLVSGATLAYGLLGSAYFHKASSHAEALCRAEEYSIMVNGAAVQLLPDACEKSSFTSAYNMDQFQALMQIIISISISFFALVRANCAWRNSETFFGGVLSLQGVALFVTALVYVLTLNADDTCDVNIHANQSIAFPGTELLAGTASTVRRCFNKSVMNQNFFDRPYSTQDSNFALFPLNPFLGFAAFWIAMKMAKVSETAGRGAASSMA
jgi:hypothetical protein